MCAVMLKKKIKKMGIALLNKTIAVVLLFWALNLKDNIFVKLTQTRMLKKYLKIVVNMGM